MVGFGWCLMTVVLVVVMTARPETRMKVWTLSAMGLVVVCTAIPWMVGRINSDGDLDNYPSCLSQDTMDLKNKIWRESPYDLVWITYVSCCQSLCIVSGALSLLFVSVHGFVIAARERATLCHIVMCVTIWMCPIVLFVMWCYEFVRLQNTIELPHSSAWVLGRSMIVHADVHAFCQG